MAKPSHLRDGDIVSRPDWNDGKPVRVTLLGAGLRIQDVHAHQRARHVEADDNTNVTLHSGGTRRSAR